MRIRSWWLSGYAHLLRSALVLSRRRPQENPGRKNPTKKRKKTNQIHEADGSIREQNPGERFRSRMCALHQICALPVSRLQKALDVIRNELEGENPLPAAVHVLKATGAYGVGAPDGPITAEDLEIQEQERNSERRNRAMFLFG